MNQQDVLREYEEYKAEGRVWGQTPVERIRKIRFARHDAALVQRYLALEDMTTTVSDLLDEHGLHGAVAASFIRPLMPGRRMAGTAVTLRSVPERKSVAQCRLDREPVRISTREIYYLGEPGDVLVADFGGNLEISNFGGQSARVGQGRGFAGAVVNGAVRDLPSMQKLGFPVWAAGVTPITGKFRMQAIEINGPVTVHDIVVEAGDLVVADDSGTCVVPQQLVQTLITAAESIVATENAMQRLVEAGAPIDELRPLFRTRYRSA